MLINPSVLIITFFNSLLIVGRIDIGGARINFQDLGGQTDLQTIWERYYRECHAIVFVVDSSDPERIEECKNALGKCPLFARVESRLDMWY